MKQIKSTSFQKLSNIHFSNNKIKKHNQCIYLSTIWHMNEVSTSDKDPCDPFSHRLTRSVVYSLSAYVCVPPCSALTG